MSSSPIDTQTKPIESISTQISILLDRLPQEPPTTQPTLDSTNNNGSNTDNTGNNNNGHLVDDNNNNNNNRDNKDNDGNNRNGNLEEGNGNRGSSSGNDDLNKEVNDGNKSQKKDLCECIRALLDKEKSNTKENNRSGKENSNKSSGGSSRKEGSNSRSPVEKLRTNLSKINDALTELGKIEEGDLGKQIQTQLDSLKKILDKKPASTDEFEKINKEINKLKHKIPSLKKTPSVGSGANQISQLSNGSGPLRTVNGLLINPHESKELKSFQDSSFYKEIQEIFDKLDQKRKFFLSCFAVFPENEVVKRRLLIYWWVGEGKVEASGTGDDAPEKIVDRYLNEFKEKGLIEPANKEQRKSTKSYRMHPLVRSAVILLSKGDGFFEYDSKGNLTTNLSQDSKGRACLVKAEEGSSKQENLDLEKVRTLFNVNEPYPDLKLGKLSKAKELSVAEWLMKMRKVNVLYLGRWQKSAEYHIEVESTEFLKGLKSMKELKLLSLQGMSRINEPPSAIGKLSSLMILDLKACHNLEVLPDEIASLKELRYMDISDCYLLDHMPRGLSSLSKLLVLKGFVIGSTQSGKKGTLDDLKGLQKLRKLTINTSTSEGFPTSKDILALHQLGTHGVLRKLTIAWGGSSNSKQGKGEGEAKLTKVPTAKPLHPRALFTLEKIKELPNKCCSKLPWGGGSKQGNDRLERRPTMIDAKLPVELEKLDLQCFPEPTPPPWLNLGNLKSLKTLYIRGGRLKTLGNDEWSEVSTLCLKYLTEFKMNWRQLQQKFPGLNYLEKVDCPKITFCPCDENGVWLKPKTN